MNPIRPIESLIPCPVSGHFPLRRGGECRAMPRRFQRGVALAMSILFLLLLTIIGVTSMNTSVLQERMAGNMRDIDIALQAAETSIRFGNNLIRPNFNVALCGSYPPNSCAGPDANGVWCPNTIQISNPAWWSTWGILLQQDATKQVAEAWEDPRHVTEYFGQTMESPQVASDSPQGGYGRPPGRILHLRVTARGLGSTGASEILLRKVYTGACP